MYGSYFLAYESGPWIFFLLAAIGFASYAQMKVSSAYNKYSRIGNGTGFSGAQVARMILDRNGLQHIRIELTPGKLTDHYDPRTRVLRLSRPIYEGNTVASMSVAAHEAGHAIQHDRGYFMLMLRNNLAPIVGIGARFVWIFIILGFAISPFFADIGIALFLGVVVFQIITLPVEFDASRRALLQLENGISPMDRIKPAKDMLGAAAMTYVASTLMALAQLLRLLAITNRRR